MTTQECLAHFFEQKSLRRRLQGFECPDKYRYERSAMALAQLAQYVRALPDDDPFHPNVLRDGLETGIEYPTYPAAQIGLWADDPIDPASELGQYVVCGLEDQIRDIEALRDPEESVGLGPDMPGLLTGLRRILADLNRGVS